MADCRQKFVAHALIAQRLCQVPYDQGDSAEAVFDPLAAARLRGKRKLVSAVKGQAPAGAERLQRYASEHLNLVANQSGGRSTREHLACGQVGFDHHPGFIDRQDSVQDVVLDVPLPLRGRGESGLECEAAGVEP